MTNCHVIVICNADNNNADNNVSKLTRPSSDSFKSVCVRSAPAARNPTAAKKPVIAVATY
eukprot:7036-Heterococcus_DN1.PRE.1